MRIKGPHAYMVIALGLCVKWPLEHFNPLPYMPCVGMRVLIGYFS